MPGFLKNWLWRSSSHPHSCKTSTLQLSCLHSPLCILFLTLHFLQDFSVSNLGNFQAKENKVDTAIACQVFNCSCRIKSPAYFEDMKLQPHASKQNLVNCESRHFPKYSLFWFHAECRVSSPIPSARHIKSMTLSLTTAWRKQFRKVMLKGGLEKVAFLRDRTAGLKANSCMAVARRRPECQHSPRTCLGRQMLLPESHFHRSASSPHGSSEGGGRVCQIWCDESKSLWNRDFLRASE